MSAEAGMLSSFMQSFPPMAEQHLLPFTDLEDLLTTNFPDAASNPSTLFQTCAISEYDLGGEGDLFKAPKPILEESLLAFDPIEAANSMIFGGESIIMEDKIQIADMESIQNEDLFCEVFYDCKNDLLAISTDAPVHEAADFMLPVLQTEEVAVGENNNIFAEGPLQKSASFGCLSSVDCTNGSLQRGLSSIGTCLLDVHKMNLEAGKSLQLVLLSEHTSSCGVGLSIRILYVANCADGIRLPSLESKGFGFTPSALHPPLIKPRSSTFSTLSCSLLRPLSSSLSSDGENLSHVPFLADGIGV